MNDFKGAAEHLSEAYSITKKVQGANADDNPMVAWFAHNIGDCLRQMEPPNLSKAREFAQEAFDIRVRVKDAEPKVKKSEKLLNEIRAQLSE